MDLQISIIIPVYGVSEYIGRFMDSLSVQTIQCFRAVFVNDQTPDNSMSIVEEYKGLFGDRMVIVNNDKNLGLCGARNAGLDYVCNNPTKYVTFLDPDDWIDEDYLEDLFLNAEQNNLDLCMSGLVRINETTGKVMCIEMVKMKTGVFLSPEECDELAYINPCAYSKLFLFEPIKKIRFINIKRSEDTCYLFEALKAYKRIMFTNNAKYHYCVRDTSLTGAMNEDKYYSMHQGFASMIGSFDKEELYGLRDLFVTQIFIRSSLGGVCRLCFNAPKIAREMEKTEYEYLEEKIPFWKHNCYLSWSRKGLKSKKGVALKVCAMMYKMHVFFIFVWVYNLIIKVTGKDFRA